MPEDDKELLARIERLAGNYRLRSPTLYLLLTKIGQINRHKNQQAGINTGPSRIPPRPHGAFHPKQREVVSTAINNANTAHGYRQASAPYPTRGFRGGRHPAVHRHRTLHLNASGAATGSGNSGDGSASGSDTSGWVSKTDRHRQLINANVYERERKTRSRALQQTRNRNLKQQRHQEKNRFNEFIKSQTGAAPATVTNSSVTPGRNEITIEGVRFAVLDGGKKLVKIIGKPGKPATCGDYLAPLTHTR